MARSLVADGRPHPYSELWELLSPLIRPDYATSTYFISGGGRYRKEGNLPPLEAQVVAGKRRIIRKVVDRLAASGIKLTGSGENAVFQMSTSEQSYVPRVNGPKRDNPARRLMEKLLSDGKWHTREEIYNTICPQIAEEEAIEMYVTSGKPAERASRLRMPRDKQVRNGRVVLVSRCLTNYRRRGDVEAENPSTVEERLRFKKGK